MEWWLATPWRGDFPSCAVSAAGNAFEIPSHLGANGFALARKLELLPKSSDYSHGALVVLVLAISEPSRSET